MLVKKKKVNYHYWICLNIPRCTYKNRILNMRKFWIRQVSEYVRVFNIPALHSVLNIREYVLAELWIYLAFQICQNSEYGRFLNTQELRRVVNMPHCGGICLNRTWICPNMSEFTIIGRVLNMYHTIPSARSLYKLMGTYWEIQTETYSEPSQKSKMVLFGKINYSFYFCKKNSFKISERV